MRTDLNVPFSRKEEAKRLGARWDMGRKVWFVPDGVDLYPFLASGFVPGVETRMTRELRRCGGRRETRAIAKVLSAGRHIA